MKERDRRWGDLEGIAGDIETNRPRVGPLVVSDGEYIFLRLQDRTVPLTRQQAIVLMDSLWNNLRRML